MPADGDVPRAPAPITSNARVFQSADRPAQNPGSANPRGVQQLKPNALPGRQSASNILVSNRQHGNPVLKEIKQQGWEYADIPADYVIGSTTCALYLSLKYHRLHPHYIYNRIRDLAGKYNLRILLVMVDVSNHEEHLKELSKTSLINNVTLILCWSAAEAGRYLELYKTYEHAPATMIKAPVSTAHGDKLIEFITTPRSINKTDAMSLVSNFGSVRTAVNARPEELLMIAGFGQTKVRQWHAAVTEPFRNRKAAKRGPSATTTPAISRDASRAEGHITPTLSRDPSRPEGTHTPLMSGALQPVPETDGDVENAIPDADKRPPKRAAEVDEIDAEEEELMREIINQDRRVPPVSVQAPPGTKLAAPAPREKPKEPFVDDGVLAALARLRDAG
jgi:DNA excision repair protein ERCC-1